MLYSFPASPKMTSTVLDINMPESRSTAQPVLSLIKSCGATCAPIFAGIISDVFKVDVAIMWVSVSVLMITLMVYVGLQFLIENDIVGLRTKMKKRAALKTQTSQAKGL